MVEESNKDVDDNDAIEETMDGCLLHTFRSHSHEFNKMCSPHILHSILAAIFRNHPVDVICSLSAHFIFWKKIIKFLLLKIYSTYLTIS